MHAYMHGSMHAAYSHPIIGIRNDNNVGANNNINRRIKPCMH